ncbi:MAG: hypothetical protein H8M99_08795 [Gloeobacteraceae cyanobacterium ES-bin-144]|nr:hypothetical protein [Verrucomicrobiales bacterium]
MKIHLLVSVLTAAIGFSIVWIPKPAAAPPSGSEGRRISGAGCRHFASEYIGSADGFKRQQA